MPNAGGDRPRGAHVGILVCSRPFRAEGPVRRWMWRGAIVKNRRGPWLSGLIAAGIGVVWMIGQVIGGVSVVTDTISLHISDGAALSAPAVSDPSGQAEFRFAPALFA